MNASIDGSNLIPFNKYSAVKHLNSGFMVATLLEKSKETLERLLDGLPLFFALIDMEGRIVRGNRELAKWFDTDIENVSGNSLFDLLDKTFRKKVLRELELASQGQTVTSSLELDSRFGLNRKLDVKFFSVDIGNIGHLKIAGMIGDVTETVPPIEIVLNEGEVVT